MKYACVARHRGEYPVRLMCRVLAVSPAGFYAALHRPLSARAQRDAQLRAQVRAIHEQSDRTYGTPRIHGALRERGDRVSPKRVARLLREQGLVARRPRRWVTTTDSLHSQPIAPNRLARRFAPRDVPGLDRVWVSDITYIPTGQGWLYLAVVLDLASRRVVGWAMRASLEVALPLAALDMAIGQRQPRPALLHHSDRGSQYAAAAYQQRLATYGMVPSMSGVGACWDNAVAESFFATLKIELVFRRRWATRDEARGAIFRYIESWYNRERRHSALGNISPAQYEERLTAA